MEIEDVYPLAGYAKSINFALIPNYNFFYTISWWGARNISNDSFDISWVYVTLLTKGLYLDLILPQSLIKM